MDAQQQQMLRLLKLRKYEYNKEHKYNRSKTVI